MKAKERHGKTDNTVPNFPEGLQTANRAARLEGWDVRRCSNHKLQLVTLKEQQTVGAA